MNEAFLDTSFAIALSSVTDQNHIRAVSLLVKSRLTKAV